MTDALPISRFPVPHLADMPEDICNRILTVQEKSGSILAAVAATIRV